MWVPDFTHDEAVQFVEKAALVYANKYTNKLKTLSEKDRKSVRERCLLGGTKAMKVIGELPPDEDTLMKNEATRMKNMNCLFSKIGTRPSVLKALILGDELVIENMEEQMQTLLYDAQLAVDIVLKDNPEYKEIFNRRKSFYSRNECNGER